MINKEITTKRGFTLIELMTAISIFLIIMTISMGSILSVFDLNRKSRALKNAVTSLNMALESMSKELRYGRLYHCNSGTGQNVPPINSHTARNCTLADAGTFIRFLSSDNQLITYRLDAGRIQRRIGSGQWVRATSPEVIIDGVTFIVRGEDSPTQQPKMFIQIRGRAGIGDDETDFTIQTMVSQRAFSI